MLLRDGDVCCAVSKPNVTTGGASRPPPADAGVERVEGLPDDTRLATGEPIDRRRDEDNELLTELRLNSSSNRSARSLRLAEQESEPERGGTALAPSREETGLERLSSRLSEPEPAGGVTPSIWAAMSGRGLRRALWLESDTALLARENPRIYVFLRVGCACV